MLFIIKNCKRYPKHLHTITQKIEKGEKKGKCFSITQFIPELFKLLLYCLFFIIYFFIMYLLSAKFGIWSSTIKTHLFSVEKTATHSINLIYYQNAILKGRLKCNLYIKTNIKKYLHITFIQVSQSSGISALPRKL